MLKLDSIKFKDDETAEIVEVCLPDKNIVTDKKITTDEYFTLSLYIEFLRRGEIHELKKFMSK